MKQILLYFGLTFLVGLVVGLLLSPDWNDPRTAERFLEEAVVPEFGVRDDVNLRAICGAQLYTYVSEEDTLGTKPVDPDTVLDPFQPSGKLLYGLPAPLLLLASDDSSFAIVVVTVAVAGGFILGYLLGHDDDPDCGTDAMVAALEDGPTWREMASQIMASRAAAMETLVDDYCASRPRWYRFESEIHTTIQSQFALVTDPPDRAFLNRLCSGPSESSRTARDVFETINTIVMGTPVEKYCDSRPRWYRFESDENTELQMQFASVLHPPDLEFLDGLCRGSSELGRTTREALEKKSH